MNVPNNLFLAMLGRDRGDAAGASPFTDEQLQPARELVRTMEEADAVRCWTMPASVVVGPTFRMLDFLQKQLGCQALDVMRQSRGFRAGFKLRDPQNRRWIGAFNMGFLSLRG